MVTTRQKAAVSRGEAPAQRKRYTEVGEEFEGNKNIILRSLWCPVLHYMLLEAPWLELYFAPFKSFCLGSSIRTNQLHLVYFVIYRGNGARRRRDGRGGTGIS